MSRVPRVVRATPEAVDLKLRDEVICRVVEASDSPRGILFGSVARGRTGPHSELPSPTAIKPENTRKATARIYPWAA